MTERARHIRARWSSYLTEVIQANEGVTVGTLARELIPGEVRAQLESMRSPGIHLQNASPRSRVRRWVNGDETVRAESAFTVGEALRQLGTPRTSGVTALFAAGFYPEVVELIVRLSHLPNGSWPALGYYVSLEQWLHRWICRDVKVYDDETREFWVLDYDSNDDHVQAAQIIAQSAIDTSSAMIKRAWRACNGGRNCDLWTKKAILIAGFESDDDAETSQSLAWQALKVWAADLYKRCGGKPGYPLMPKTLRLSDYRPPLEMIVDLIPES